MPRSTRTTTTRRRARGSSAVTTDASGDRARAFLGILDLEQSRTFNNKAVSGGLDRFLGSWQKESGTQTLLRRLEKAELLSVAYASLSTDARAKWVEKARSLSIDSSGSSPSATPAKRPSVDSAMSSDRPVSVLRSVTSRVASPLRKLGLETVGDLVRLFPRRHNQVRRIGDIQPDQEQTVVGGLWGSPNPPRRGDPRRIIEAAFFDDTGNIRVVWYNQPYLARSLKADTRYVLSGRASIYRGRLVLSSPHHEELRSGDSLEQLVQPGRLFPVYPLTEGITQQTMRRVVREALARGVDGVQETLPEDILHRNGLPEVRRALWQAHYPDTGDSYEEARRRLAFEELLLLQLAVLAHRKAAEGQGGGVALVPPTGLLDAFLDSLPFRLTSSQRRVLDEILGDMARGGRPMSRLLQGEVGSGKTVVALAALVVAAACGYQGAIMAPTEVLAEQHFLTVRRLLEGLADPAQSEFQLSITLDPLPKPITVGLLLGSMTAKQKREMHGLLSEGAIDVIIGTHAIIQEDVEIPRLGLAVVDEQQRFGVMQRATLRRRGDSAHLLVMSATPIPRTLALTLYGDLDLSTIDELPPGRQTIRTRVVETSRRFAVYDFIRKEIEAGRQAFVIYPLIDESEAINARAAVKESDRLATDVFPNLRVGLLHGRMAMSEKQEVMDRFRNGEIDVLVSTPVVEVGIDVPNATVMLIEGADRFGLAQLHQFRGRVGRGEHASYCILVAEAPSDDARERLSAMERIDDGFQLAEVDLQLRGPGDYFGTRQSGLPDLRMARLTDTDILALAREEARTILDRDPALAEPEHAALAQALSRFTAPVGGEVG